VNIKHVIQSIKNEEGPKKFGRANSKVNTFESEIASFINHPNYTTMRMIDQIKFILSDFDLLYTSDDFKIVFSLILLRADGRINSSLVARNVHVKHFFRRVDRRFPALAHYSVHSKWSFLKNDMENIPRCKQCGSEVNRFADGYVFCSHHCWSISEDLKEHARNTISQHEWTDERREEQSKRMVLMWENHDFRDTVIPKLKEANQGNGQRLLDDNRKPHNYNKPTPQYVKDKIAETKRRNGTSHAGKNNGMYGKSPSPLAGRGISGRFGNLWFRSSLELFYLIHWHISGEEVVSAESNEFRVEYTIDEDAHTYSPDFLVNGTIYEIKPHKRTTETINQNKMNELKNSHSPKFECVFGTEWDIKDTILNITSDHIEKYINDDILIISDDQLERLWRALNETRRSIQKV
jgi:hypothetical protein